MQQVTSIDRCIKDVNRCIKGIEQIFYRVEIVTPKIK